MEDAPTIRSPTRRQRQPAAGTLFSGAVTRAAPKSLGAPREGEILAGRYRVERALGAGGMGVVVSALDLALGARVAIKVLLPDLSIDPGAVARFLFEAATTARIENEHVVRVLDVGFLETTGPYIVMELLEGADLAALLKRVGALSLERAVELLLQVCDGVAEAHALGVVHRDLKPSNLFVARGSDGALTMKVIDFGVAKIMGSSEEVGVAPTHPAVIVGSPHYMAPEQIRAARGADQRADIWSMGVVLYQMLADDLPFSGGSLPEICAKIAGSRPERLDRRRPDLPRGVGEIVHKCLERDRARRYGSVVDLAAALGAFAPGRARSAVDRLAWVVEAARPPRNERERSNAVWRVFAAAAASFAGWVKGGRSSRLTLREDSCLLVPSD